MFLCLAVVALVVDRRAILVSSLSYLAYAAGKLIAAAGLEVARLRDVVPRESLPPLFTLFACRHRAEAAGPMQVEEPLVVREESGRLSAAMAAVRRRFGFRDGEAHGFDNHDLSMRRALRVHLNSAIPPLGAHA